MSKSLIIKVSLLVIAIALIVGGRGYWSRHKLAEEIKKDVAMGRYNRALESLDGARESRRYRLSRVLYGEDPYIAYNTGVVLMLMGDTKRAGVEFKQAATSDNEAIKENAIYNRANIMATNMDFYCSCKRVCEGARDRPGRL